MKARVSTDIREYIISIWLSGDGRGFDEETDLQESGILDSFSTLALIAYLDERFKTQIDPSDVSADAFRTVNTLTTLVLTKMG